jgi:hypothetical protein
MKATLGGFLGKIPTPTPAMAVALLALLIAASGAAVAAIPSSDGTITACRDNKTGALRVIDAASQMCTSKETQLTWKDGIHGTVANADNAANADKLDNKDSADFYAAGSKVADSELLDGKSADDLSRVAVMNTSELIQLPFDGSHVTYGQQLSITAPAAGFVRVNGNVSVLKLDRGCPECYFGAWVRHVNTGTLSSAPAADDVGALFGNVGLDAVFPVSAGVNTFDISLQGVWPEGDTSRMYGHWGVLTAEYTPYGSTGTDTQSASEAATASEGSINKELPKR